jgi:RNA polymerase sigma-70 factor (ECF subfamily)
MKQMLVSFVNNRVPKDNYLMKKSDYNEDELKHLALEFVKGKVEAFSTLYDLYVENIYRFIYFKVNSAEAEDLTEIVFIKVWENRAKFDPSKSSISSWIYTIARNTVIDHYRVLKHTEELSDNFIDSESNNPQRLVEEKIVSLKVRSAINKLPENYRDILLLRFIEDFSYSEIAKILGKSEGSIRILQFRAIKELKKVLQKMGFDE